MAFNQEIDNSGVTHRLPRTCINCPFGLFTGGLVMLPKIFKKKNGPYTGPVLLRQGELLNLARHNTALVKSFAHFML